MEDLPAELVQTIALYVGWEGYPALRATSRWMRACLPWRLPLHRGHTRTVPVSMLPWDQTWFARHVPAETTVQGTWVLDGFHGVVFLLGLGESGLGESVCARGLLEGVLVLHSPWRGGMSLTQRFHAGMPLHERMPRPERHQERPNDLPEHPPEHRHGDHDEPLRERVGISVGEGEEGLVED